MPNHSKHENYDILNLIGYGLSKFDIQFTQVYGFRTKQSFYEYIVNLEIAETTGTVKNRQDLFDGMESGGVRKGWWQKGPVYKFRKDYIDSLFGTLDVNQFVEVVKMSIIQKFGSTVPVHKFQKDEATIKASPIIRSYFKQMQITGREAEYYFINNYKMIEPFVNANLEDARLFGDGYDFQLSLPEHFYLVEVKGLRSKKGRIRLTQKEYDKATEYKNDYVLAVVKNLLDVPKLISIFDPIANLSFEKHSISREQEFYQSTI